MSDIPKSHVQSNNRHHHCLCDVGQCHNAHGRRFDPNQIVTRATAWGYLIFFGFLGDRKEGCGRLRDMMDTHLDQKRRYILLREIYTVVNKSQIYEMRLLGPNNMPRYLKKKDKGIQCSILIFERKLNRTMQRCSDNNWWRPSPASRLLSTVLFCGLLLSRTCHHPVHTLEGWHKSWSSNSHTQKQ